MSYKTLDGLMRHLRKNGIHISGSKEKRQLRNTGYFHVYKGYRYFKDSDNKIPFESFSELNATIQYDNELKNLFYSKIMYIETAIKNIALESILRISKSEKISDMFDNVIISYHKAPKSYSENRRKKLQEKRLKLINRVNKNLSAAYHNDNSKVTYYYHDPKYMDVPIWSLFEIMTMGELGYLLSCLTFEVRDDISNMLGLNKSLDSERILFY